MFQVYETFFARPSSVDRVPSGFNGRENFTSSDELGVYGSPLGD